MRPWYQFISRSSSSDKPYKPYEFTYRSSPSAMASHGAHSSSTANLVGVNYRVGKKIGEGSFGVIFEGTDLLNNQMVAIKFEPRKSDAPQLRDECLSYRILAGCSQSFRPRHCGLHVSRLIADVYFVLFCSFCFALSLHCRCTAGVPQIYHFGLEGLHNILVMDLLGPSLEDLFDMCGRKFSVKTVCMTALQMISLVQTIHEKNLIHRGIKPDNFLIGRPGTKHANLVHIIDFGTAKHYRDPETKQHVPYGERKGLGGTANYMSINTHLGGEQSRRDDLEALGYVIFYFLRGSLPWQGLAAATNKQKYEKIGEKKQIMRIGELCDSFPGEFGVYLAYVRKLSFEETPDYEFLRALFSGVLKNLDEVDDSRYDWDELNGGRGWESQLTSSSSTQGTPDRHRDDRGRRASAQPTASGVVPPSPALVRHSSKKRKLPAAFVPDNATPSRAGAEVGVSPASPAALASMQQHAVATDDVVIRPVLRHFSDAAHERTPKEVLEQLLSKLNEFDLTDKIQEGRQWCAGGGYSDVFLGFDSYGTRVAIKRLRFFMQGEHMFNKPPARDKRA
ncbi:kinase-like protein [Phellopilus nigrolimitatus]|nr:kinase-like protein [Phellopilus nigrolimitatus]